MTGPTPRNLETNVYCDHCGARIGEVEECPWCATPVAAVPAGPLDSVPTAGPPPQRRQRQPPRSRTRGQHPPNRLARFLAVVIGPRALRGNLAGLFAAWFNMPLVLFMSLVGALFGGLAGLFSGTVAGSGVLTRLNALLTWVLPMPFSVEDLLPVAAIQVGGIVGALWGAATGALRMAFVFSVGPWQLLYAGDPSWPLVVAVGQVATAVFVAVLYTLYSVTTEGWRLRVAGARRPSRREARWLEPIVREAARRMGATTVPVLLIDDSHETNATAGTRHIVINQGILDLLGHDREAVAGVIAHEIAHWYHGDAVTMAWGKGVALPLHLANELAFRAQQKAGFVPLQLLVRTVLWSVTATMRYFVVPMHAAQWRSCEYRADAAAKAVGYGDGLYRALARLGRTFDGARTGWDVSMCATHPPTELRLERLEGPGGHYPMPHEQAASRRAAQVVPVRSGPDKD